MGVNLLSGLLFVISGSYDVYLGYTKQEFY